MNKVGTWIAGVAAVIGGANIVMAAVWWNMISVTVEMPITERGYTIEALALNITILEIVLALVGVVLAVIGIFGYSGIKTAAVESAREAAKREANVVAGDQMREFIRQEARQNRAGLAESPGSHGSTDVSVTNAAPAEGSE